MSSEPLKVCYFGTYRANYPRNQIMIEGLRRNNVEVIECHETLWHGVEDRVHIASGNWRKPSFWWRVVRTYSRLIWHYIQTHDHDILIVGYPGQFDVYLARLLSWLRGKPLVWDVFMSVYLIALERGLDQHSSFTVNWIRRMEGLALRLPDLLIQDTEQYAKWLSQVHGVDIDRFRLIPTGADDRIFQPADQPRSANGDFRIIYYGTFIPNHGVMYIIEAAQLLKDEKEIKFELIGDGPIRPIAEELVNDYELGNVKFVGWLNPKELTQRAAQADLLLGAFGTTPQSIMTVQNKIYEGLAMARPVISGDAEAVRQVLENGKQIILCPRADGASLANAIRSLYKNGSLREQLARNGYKVFISNFNLKHNGQKYSEHLRNLLNTYGND